MRSKPSRRPPPRAVQRHFEPSRLASACQARAYDQVVAAAVAARTTTGGPEPAVPALAPPDYLFISPEGVAV